MAQMKVIKCPTDDLAVMNCAILNKDDFDATTTPHVSVRPTAGVHRYIFTVKNYSVHRGEIAFPNTQRSWASLSLSEPVIVEPHRFKSNEYIGCLTVSVDFLKKKDATPEPFDTDKMALEFSQQFVRRAFTKGEKIVFPFKNGPNGKPFNLSIFVKGIDGIDPQAIARSTDDDGSKPKPAPVEAGVLLPDSPIVFDKEEGAQINLIGKCKGKSAYRSVINPNWNFQEMGIGGLDKEVTVVFRRAFASRVFPPELSEQLGIKHVRGILLYGPPGTGKTLMARQIGKMLNAREPKIVNGPSILDKYVGESESNIRKLFADAEEEWKRCGSNSGLHIVIFDELDAICKQRGSMAGSSSVHDTVVNQLLSKMDGVEQLNNILVIGMTNRRDMIDEALLRPGRLEVQVEIGLPDEFGRLQILRIHTSKMRQYNKLAPDVDLDKLAKDTRNFSGAEIEGLVRAAQSRAMHGLLKPGGKLDPDAAEKLMVAMPDFEYALENDVKPAFGRGEESLERFIRNGCIPWGPEVTQLLEKGDTLVRRALNPESSGFVKAVLVGRPNSGSSCLAAMIAKKSEFPCIKVVTPLDMVAFNESSKCLTIRKAFEDASKSKISVLLLDDLEELADYSRVGPRYSNQVLRTLKVLLKKPPPPGHRMLILATSSNRGFLEDFELLQAFGFSLDVPQLSRGEHIAAVLSECDLFSTDLLPRIEGAMKQVIAETKLNIGIKQLLDVIEYCREYEENRRGSVLIQTLQDIALGLQ